MTSSWPNTDLTRLQRNPLGKGKSFHKSGVRTTGNQHGERINLNPYFIISYPQITVRCKSYIYNSLEENIEENRCDLEANKYFLDRTQKTLTTKNKVINWTSSKWKTSTQQERIMKTTNRQTVNYQKTLDKSDKGPVYRIHKELSQLNIKKQKHQWWKRPKNPWPKKWSSSTWRSIQYDQSSK